MHRGELYRSVKRALVYSRVSTDAQEQGSLLKHSNLMSADRDGVLCPKHYVRVNSLLVDV